MYKKTSRHLPILALLGLILLSGCAGYGQARYQGPAQGQEVLTNLMADFDDYHVYYSGMSEAYPAGLIFDPQGDGRSIAQKKWTKVQSRELAKKLVRKLERYQDYQPSLYVLLGEDGQDYGYIYTGYKQIIVRQLEEGKIHVREMFEPPHLKYDPNGSDYDPGPQ